MLDEMLKQLDHIQDEVKVQLEKVNTQEEINELKIKFLGKKGELTAVLKGMGKLSGEDRPKVGQVANEIRSKMEGFIGEKTQLLKKEYLAHQIEKEKIDVTMSGENILMGQRHPLTLVIDEMKDIFLGMGYEIAEGPEVENDYNNFEGLNLPKDHPARDMQ
ncbi:MAG: phenylalanine--tRNA ligase subunit alpha, partial [Clostridiales bacterium]